MLANTARSQNRGPKKGAAPTAQAHDPPSPEPGAATGAVCIAGAAKQPETQPPKRFAAHYLLAVLIACIFEVFALICPVCSGAMRIIAFITDGAAVRNILAHIGVQSLAPRITVTRGPPLWDGCGALPLQGVEAPPRGGRARAAVSKLFSSRRLAQISTKGIKAGV